MVLVVVRPEAARLLVGPEPVGLVPAVLGPVELALRLLAGPRLVELALAAAVRAEAVRAEAVQAAVAQEAAPRAAPRAKRKSSLCLAWCIGVPFCTI